MKPLNQNKMKQTAIEWLFEKLWNADKDKFTWYAILKQAKEMEKQQIVDAWNNGFEENRPYVDHSEDYYNETFKQQSVTDDNL